MARSNKNPNANGKNPNAKTILSGSKKPQNKAHDSPTGAPRNQPHSVDVRSRVIKSPRPAPSEPTPKATAYQKPSPPIKDNQYPGLPHVDLKVKGSPKKEPSYVWKGVNVDTKGGSPNAKSKKKG